MHTYPAMCAHILCYMCMHTLLYVHAHSTICACTLYYMCMHTYLCIVTRIYKHKHIRNPYLIITSNTIIRDQIFSKFNHIFEKEIIRDIKEIWFETIPKIFNII